MKDILSFIALSAMTTCSVAATPAQYAPSVAKTPPTHSVSYYSNTSTAPMALNDSKPPLNKYGAVDVNAKIPYNVQAPAPRHDFIPPKIRTLAQPWQRYLPSQPSLQVKSYILKSARSGQIIAAYHANQREAPASLTKLMLILLTEQALVQGAIHLDDPVTVPTVAWATGGSRMFLKPHEQVSLNNLIEGTIVASGNDAAVTIANYIAGNQASFVSLMNHQACKLGMTNTHFTDVMGLPASNHYSSSYDMGLLGQTIVNDYPQYLSWFSKKYFTYNGIRQANFNKLLFIDADAIGLKTGSTDAAGYSLVSAAKQHNHDDGMTLIGVVMGASSPMASATASKALLTYGFRFFGERALYHADKIIKKVIIASGVPEMLPVGVQHDVWVTYPKAMASRLTAVLHIQDNLKAPITKGQQVGNVTITLGKNTLKVEPVFALIDVRVWSFWDKIKHLF